MPPKILCTFPGKHGDILWALPSVRAVAEAIDAPVDLAIAGQFAGLVPLLREQAYLSDVVALDSWAVQDTAPISPRIPHLTDPCAYDYDYILDLGYRGWPNLSLPYETEDCLRAQWPSTLPTPPAISLERPWIQPPSWAERLNRSVDIADGFTSEYFELKVGLVDLLAMWGPGYPDVSWVHLSVGRWTAERTLPDISWEAAAAWLSRVPVFLGCTSALHVLACAVGGTQVILMEPNPNRHHPIFYPYGKSGGRVTLVTGNDGQPTWDARHVWEAIEAARAKVAAGTGVPA